MLLTHLALNDASLGSEYFKPYLGTIERRIHSSPNRTRDAMNSALIAIALRSPELKREGIAAARRIGKVEVDHGETSCKTHDAEEYILKTGRHREQLRRRQGSGEGANGANKH
jgi:hypothetical protein